MRHRIPAALIASAACAAMIFAVEPQEIVLMPNQVDAKESPQKTSDDPDDVSHLSLTEQDYQEVARELNVEVAAIKAIVEIEAGTAHKGFHAPGKPIINFDISMFRQFANRNGVKLGSYSRTHSEVFGRPNIRRYGSQQAAQHARLEQAMTIDRKTAIQGTFWGMFQLGGFNWKLCGCKSMDEFVEKMSRSERDQLELFAKFIINTGLDRHLRAKNWAQFARIYNGPSYAARGYHTKMARAYSKYRNR